MQNWKLILAYDGSAFHGWQVQPGLPTIQGTLAAALHHLTGETVLPQGSGRTDAGVHALAQVASFPLQAAIPAGNLHRALNRALPASIRVLSAEPVPAGFHARHDAVRKSYEYRIFPRARPGEPDTICPPMLAPYVWDCPWPLDLGAAQEAAAQVIGEHDFTSFAASDPDRASRACELPLPPSNRRTIFASSWSEQRDDAGVSLLVYCVTGSGFLHHMVRNLVGTFVDIGCGRLPPGAIGEILAAKDRSSAGPTAPGRGLFLHSVEYPVL